MGGSYTSSHLHCRKTILFQLVFAWKTQTFWALPAYFGIFCWLPLKWLQWGNLWAEELWIPSQAFGELQGLWLQLHVHSSTVDIYFALCKVLNPRVLHDLCQRKEIGISDAQWLAVTKFTSISPSRPPGNKICTQSASSGSGGFLKVLLFCVSSISLPKISSHREQVNRFK